MTRTTGRSAFLSLLKDEGITHLFGNPGTTELPVMHALMDHPELTYVMAMQESLVVAMADGFSRASGKSSASRRAMAPHNASQPKCLHWPMSAPPLGRRSQIHHLCERPQIRSFLPGQLLTQRLQNLLV